MTICNLADNTICKTEKEIKQLIKNLNTKISECNNNDKTGIYEYDRKLMRDTRDQLIDVVNNINALKLKEIIRDQEEI